MNELLLRLGIVVLVSLATWLVIYLGRSFVQRQRKQALSAVAPASINGGEAAGTSEAASENLPVRILAFSSEDCRPCHTLQAPALQCVLAQRGEAVSIVDIDAPSSPELTQTYRVLTVPTTVVLDAQNHVHAVNYGFANATRLLEQIDEILANVAIDAEVAMSRAQ
jgi:thioredoxin 1